MKRRYIYLLVLLVLYTGASLYHYFRVSNWSSQKYVLQPSTSKLVLGDSHASLGFDPGAMSQTENLSIHSEFFIYTYYKLKFLSDHVKNFDQVKQIVLTVSPASVNSRRDRTMRGYDPEKSHEFFGKYYPLMDKEGMNDCFGFNGAFFYHFLKYDLYVPFNVIDDMGKKVPEKLYDLDFIAGYHPRDSSNTADSIIRKAVFRHFMDEDSSAFDTGLSSTQIKYLNKIIVFCQQKQIRLNLVTLPLHPKYRALIPADYFNRVKKTYEQTAAQKNVHYYDLSTYFDQQLQYFKDGDHLNSKGAHAISIYVDQLITKNQTE